jgi:single-strand selective monofunctional uracil DNA glycosylase
VIGVGQVAAAAAQRVGAPRVGVIPHPSPANPAANRGWSALATQALVAQGVW